MLIPLPVLPELEKLNLGTVHDELPRMSTIVIRGVAYFVFPSFLMYDTDDNSYSWLLLFKNKTTNERKTYICDTDYRLSEIHADSRVVSDVLNRDALNIKDYQVLECDNPLSKFIDSVSNGCTNYFEVSINNVVFKLERNDVERYILALIELYKKTGKTIDLKINLVSVDIPALASITTKIELKAKDTYIIKMGEGIFFSPCDPIKFLDGIVLSTYLHEDYVDSMNRKIRSMHKTYECLSPIKNMDELVIKYASRCNYNINWVTNTCYLRFQGVVDSLYVRPEPVYDLQYAEINELHYPKVNLPISFKNFELATIHKVYFYSDRVLSEFSEAKLNSIEEFHTIFSVLSVKQFLWSCNNESFFNRLYLEDLTQEQEKMMLSIASADVTGKSTKMIKDCIRRSKRC